MRSFLREGVMHFKMIILHHRLSTNTMEVNKNCSYLTNESNISGVNGEQSNHKYSIEILLAGSYFDSKVCFSE